MDKAELIAFLLGLTNREREVLYWKCRNRTHSQIAGKLGISVATINTHSSNVYSKLGYSGEKEEMFARLKEEVCEDFRIILPDEEALANWDDISITLEEELKNLQAIPVGGDSPFGGKNGVNEPDRREQLRRAAEDLQNRFIDFAQRTERNVIALIGVIVVLVIVIGFLLIQRACQPELPPASPPEEQVVVTVVITATPPPQEPESEEVVQVVPPTDTAVPIPPTETFTPTITLTPTLTPTPTITHTPTIAPTDVEVGPDNLPLTFEGTMTQPYFGTFPMIFYIEERNGDRVSGKTHYPELYNLIYGWEGEIVHDFGDITEESKWMKLEAYGSEGGTWIKETRRWNIQGTNSATDGNYYLFISDTGKVTGNWFRWNNVEPGPPFTLYISD